MENKHLYYAHTGKDDSPPQTVKDHLSMVSEYCREYCRILGCGDSGELIGLFHDFGKYSERFAEVLKHRKTHINHAFPGAAVIWNYCEAIKTNETVAQMLSTVVASHHGSIRVAEKQSVKDCLIGNGDGYDCHGKEYSLFGAQDYSEAMDVFKKENALKRLKPTLPVSPDKCSNKLERMLCVRMMLSALADADYTDTASVNDNEYVLKTVDAPFDPHKAMERLLELREEKQKYSISNTELNRLRQKLFDDCIKSGKKEPGIYTLTAPTGLGKTLSLMAFALQHCIEHPEMRRVILLLPFLAIAKQNAADYRRIFPNLLESHSAAEWNENTKNLSERWSPPCIITTNVGFFEPLFADSAANVRRIHQIANSVIVLDEAQSLPPALLDTTLKTIRSLCDNYGCTFVFSTATQPNFESRPALADIWHTNEIVPKPQELFEKTRRVNYEWRVDKKVSFESIARELSEQTFGCVIVNLRKHASILYDQICLYRNTDEVLLLSTDLCQTHREEVVAKVKKRLADGIPTLLISTQCIEAGVDLDFPILYRALAPLESIIQAAGRVNRNGKIDGGGRVIVFIPDIEEKQLYPKGTYYRNAANCVLTLLKRHPIDCSNLSHIKEYYDLLYPYDGGDKKELLKCIENEDYSGTTKEYKMIESGGVHVIVPWQNNDEAMALYEDIRNRYDKKGLTADIIAESRKITVTSFERDSVKAICQAMTCSSWNECEESDTGWYMLGVPDVYDAKKGLSLHNKKEEMIF